MGSKRYTDEFKTQVIRQVVVVGRPVMEVARQAGISHKSLYLWLKAARAQKMSTPGNIKVVRQKIRRLKTLLNKRRSMGAEGGTFPDVVMLREMDIRKPSDGPDVLEHRLVHTLNIFTGKAEVVGMLTLQLPEKFWRHSPKDKSRGKKQKDRSGSQ